VAAPRVPDRGPPAMPLWPIHRVERAPFRILFSGILR